ncbi:MAG: hypothetical protein JMDDDDMK_02385 [Acidobacteria bacterium]|nr:hypothetical protein [Acidobacteriota bacterium]
MTENTSNNQPPVEERLSQIENTLREVATSQQLIISKLGLIEADLSALKVEVTEIKGDAKLRYVDLRECIDLTRDKLGVMQRELNEFIKDTTNPPFASTPTR